MSEKSERITVLIPEDMLRRLEEVMKRKGYATKSELIRDALREFLEKVGEERK